MYPRNPGEASTVSISAVARATSAAPTIFDSVKIDGREFIDRGFGYNNPSLEAFIEVEQMYKKYERDLRKVKARNSGLQPQPDCGVSLEDAIIDDSEPSAQEVPGTPVREKVAEEQRTPSDPKTDSDAKDKRSTMNRENEGSRSYVDLLISIGAGKREYSRFSASRSPLRKYLTYISAATAMVSDAEDTHLKLSDIAERSKASYYRFNEGRATSAIRVDEWQVWRGRNETLEKITHATDAYCSLPKVQASLRRCAELLLAHRLIQPSGMLESCRRCLEPQLTS